MKTELYRHYDADGVLLYVGISLSSVTRLSQHRDHSHWFEDISSVKIVAYDTREAAIAAETEAIKKESPKYNIQKREKNKKTRYQKAQESVDDLTNNIVNYKAMYNEEDASKLLLLGKSTIRSLIESKTLGAILVSTSIRSTKAGPREFKKYLITGWQVIEFIEECSRAGSIKNLVKQAKQ